MEMFWSLNLTPETPQCCPGDTVIFLEIFKAGIYNLALKCFFLSLTFSSVSPVIPLLFSVSP